MGLGIYFINYQLTIDSGVTTVFYTRLGFQWFSQRKRDAHLCSFIYLTGNV